jgi:SAM-dependent methyltransferase
MYDVTSDFDGNYKVDFGGGSGNGSLQKYGAVYSKLLLSTLEKLPSSRVVDYGCGNMETYRDHINWKETKHHYVGVDCSETVIQTLKSMHPETEFHQVPAFQDSEFLHGDVIVVKDVFIHWYDDQIEWFKRTLLPKFTYGIFTHGDDLSHHDTGRHKWRPVHHENFFNVIEKKPIVLDRLKNFTLVVSG